MAIVVIVVMAQISGSGLLMRILGYSCCLTAKVGVLRPCELIKELGIACGVGKYCRNRMLLVLLCYFVALSLHDSKRRADGDPITPAGHLSIHMLCICRA